MFQVNQAGELWLGGAWAGSMKRKVKEFVFVSAQSVSLGAENTSCFKRVLKRRPKRNYTVGIQHITDALVACGYTCLDEQAKALGVSRSTAWTIVKTKHKLGRLSAKTTTRILTNAETPPTVRDVVRRYLAERSG